MLAALLTNLGVAPSPPPAGPVGGGYPLYAQWYLYKEEVEEAKEHLAPLDIETLQVQVDKAVVAIKTDAPKRQQILINSEKAYARVLAKLPRYERSWAADLWRAEIARKVHEEAELQELYNLLPFLLD